MGGGASGLDKPAGFRPFRDGMRPAVARFVRSSPGRPAAPFARSSTKSILLPCLYM